MRTLSSGAATEIAKPVTTPGYFVEILFASPLRLSSRETLSWSGNSWVSWDLDVTGLSAEADVSTQSGQIVLGDTDNTLAALILAQGIADRAINVWKFYGSAPGPTDPVAMFAGVGDEARFDPDAGRVTVTLAQQGGVTLFSPRRYITKAEGFSVVPAAGAILTWNGETIRLLPEGS